MGGQLPHETTTMLSVRKHLMVNIIKKYCVCNGNHRTILGIYVEGFSVFARVRTK